MIILLLIILFCLTYVLIPPSKDWIYTNTYGEYVRIINNKFGKIVVEYLGIDRNGKILFSTNPINMDWFEFKVRFIKWKKF